MMKSPKNTEKCLLRSAGSTSPNPSRPCTYAAPTCVHYACVRLCMRFQEQNEYVMFYIPLINSLIPYFMTYFIHYFYKINILKR